MVRRKFDYEKEQKSCFERRKRDYEKEVVLWERKFYDEKKV